MSERGYDSMGRNMNWDPCCFDCPHLIKGGPDRTGGWCGNPENRVPPSDGWPDGFTPSVAPDGGCDQHPRAIARCSKEPTS